MLLAGVGLLHNPHTALLALLLTQRCWNKNDSRVDLTNCGFPSVLELTMRIVKKNFHFVGGGLLEPGGMAGVNANSYG